MPPQCASECGYKFQVTRAQTIDLLLTICVVAACCLTSVYLHFSWVVGVDRSVDTHTFHQDSQRIAMKLKRETVWREQGPSAIS